MILDVLVCHADGSQTLERRTVPDSWLEVKQTESEEGNTSEIQPEKKS